MRPVALERAGKRLVPVLVVVRAARCGTVDGRRSAPPSLRMPPSSGLSMPGTFEPGSCTSMSRVPTRGSTGFGSSSRTRSRSRRWCRCGSTSGSSTGKLALRAARRIPRRHASPGRRAERRGRARRAGRSRTSARGRRGRPCSRRAGAGRAAASRRGRGSRSARPASFGSTAAMSVETNSSSSGGEAAVDVHVRPGPQLVGRREALPRSVTSMNGSGRSCDVRAVGELVSSSTIEREPRPQPALPGPAPPGV